MLQTIATRLGANVETVALTGGVPGFQIKLSANQYDAAKQLLTQLYGQPQTVQPWHPSHTKALPPLRFDTGKAGIGDHVNLISMGQRKRHVLVTTC